jgi:D-tyrosyl-tRNA(Tyr) deacylase
MKAVLQRVLEAQVEVDHKVVGKIDKGLLVLVGFGNDDTEEDMDWILRKMVQLRIFDDQNGVMNFDIQQIGGKLLLVSQFTLMASTKKGNRPSYIAAASPTISEAMYQQFLNKCKKIIPTEAGIFGADMKVSLINDGPVTICLDSKNKI